MSIVVDPQANESGDSQQVTSQQAAVPANPLEYVLPADFEGIDPTYRGKSVADIIEMQVNATRKIGEQANEIGAWRGIVSQLTESQQAGTHARAQGAQQPDEEKPLEITSDKLLDDPEGSIAAIVERSLERSLKPFREQLQTNTVSAEHQRFQSEYPEAKDIGTDPKFQEWVSKTPRRQALTQKTLAGDYDAARDLLDAWRDANGDVQDLAQASTDKSGGPEAHPFSGKPSGVAGAKKTATESGGAGGGAKPMLNGNDIINLMNNDPAKYRSEAYQAELRLAAKEGRISLS